MELLEMFTRIKRLTWNGTYAQEEFLSDLNVVKDKFWSKYVACFNDNRHYEEWTITGWILANQSEYTLEEVLSNNEWVKLLNSVEISYTGELYPNTQNMIYNKSTRVDRNALPRDWNYYLENQPIDKPLYHLSDNSIFIAPTPREWQVGLKRLKVTGVRNIKDYTMETTNLIIPSDFHYILELWVIAYCLQGKRVDANETLNAQNTYAVAERTAIEWLKKRMQWPITMTYPTYREDTFLNL